MPQPDIGGRADAQQRIVGRCDAVRQDERIEVDVSAIADPRGFTRVALRLMQAKDGDNFR